MNVKGFCPVKHLWLFRRSFHLMCSARLGSAQFQSFTSTLWINWIELNQFARAHDLIIPHKIHNINTNFEIIKFKEKKTDLTCSFRCYFQSSNMTAQPYQSLSSLWRKRFILFATSLLHFLGILNAHYGHKHTTICHISFSNC